MQQSDNILHQAAPALVQAFHGRRHMPAGRWLGPQCLPHWSISYCPGDGFEVELTVPGAAPQHLRRRPRLWQLNPPRTTVHSFCHDPRPFEVGSWVVFDLDPEAGILPRHACTSFADPDERLAELVTRLHEVQQRGERGKALLELGLLTTLIGELGVAVHRGGTGDQDDPHLIRVPGPEGLLAQVDRILLAEIGRPWTLQAIADHLHCSVSSLSHRFRDETGLTVVQRIRWLRIREARRLLGQGELGIQAIANRLGFSSPAYFTRVFNQHVGMTPAAFRRLLL